MAGNSLAIRLKLQEVLLRVPGVGQVHAYERYAKSELTMRQFYQYGEQIRGWHIRRVRQRRSSNALGSWTITSRWELKGFLSLNDELMTEQTMDDLVDLIADEFQLDEELGGTIDTFVVGEEAGIQLEDSGPYLFAGVLCHGVRLALVTRHYEQ